MFIGTRDAWRKPFMISSRPTVMRYLNIRSKEYSICMEVNLHRNWGPGQCVLCFRGKRCGSRYVIYANHTGRYYIEWVNTYSCLPTWTIFRFGPVLQTKPNMGVCRINRAVLNLRHFWCLAAKVPQAAGARGFARSPNLGFAPLFIANTTPSS